LQTRSGKINKHINMLMYKTSWGDQLGRYKFKSKKKYTKQYCRKL